MAGLRQNASPVPQLSVVQHHYVIVARKKKKKKNRGAAMMKRRTRVDSCGRRPQHAMTLYSEVLLMRKEKSNKARSGDVRGTRPSARLRLCRGSIIRTYQRTEAARPGRQPAAWF